MLSVGGSHTLTPGPEDPGVMLGKINDVTALTLILGLL